jgi:hypothetical protein
MAKAVQSSQEAGEVGAVESVVSRNGVAAGEEQGARLSASSFASMRDQLLDMRDDKDLTPSQAGHGDDYIPLGKPSASY